MRREGSITKKIGTILRFAGFVILLVALVMGFRHYVVESLHISTFAMETTLHRGDLVLVNKLPSPLQKPKRCDIMLFTSPLQRDSVDSPLLISRCIGIPGDTIEVRPDCYVINGKKYSFSPNSLHTYFMPKEGEPSLFSLLKKLQIPQRDRKKEHGGVTLTLTSFEEYQLRKELPDSLKSLLRVHQASTYQFVIPQKDRAYRLDSLSLLACKEAILNETNSNVLIRNGKLYIEGKETDFFFFRQDYYWFLSDNVTDAVDSRHVGVVPENHLIGKLFFCWFSKDKDKRFKRL